MTNKLVPPIPLHNPAFKYIPACKTDIKKRFDAERAKLQAAKEKK